VTTTTAPKNAVEFIDDNDPLAAAMNPQENDNAEATYFGEIMYLAGEFVAYDPQSRRFVPYDAGVHTRRNTQITLKIAPLRADFQAIERQMLDTSSDWKKVTLQSLIALGVAAPALIGKFVQYQLRPTGEIYLKLDGIDKALVRELSREAQQFWTAAGADQAKYNAALMGAGHADWISATKIKKSPWIVAIYPDREACQAAADAFFAGRGGSAASTAPTPAAATAATAPAGDTSQMKAFALKSAEMKWTLPCGGQVGVFDAAKYEQFKTLFAADPTVSMYLAVDSPEVNAITGYVPF
jgi:hypothetical protein